MCWPRKPAQKGRDEVNGSSRTSVMFALLEQSFCELKYPNAGTLVLLLVCSVDDLWQWPLLVPLSKVKLTPVLQPVELIGFVSYPAEFKPVLLFLRPRLLKHVAWKGGAHRTSRKF